MADGIATVACETALQLRVVVNPKIHSVIAGSRSFSEVECLMMMFGSGASTCATRFEADFSRFNEVTTTPSRRGHHGFRKRAGDWDRVRICYAIFSPPRLKLVPFHTYPL